MSEPEEVQVKKHTQTEDEELQEEIQHFESLAGQEVDQQKQEQLRRQQEELEKVELLAKPEAANDREIQELKHKIKVLQEENEELKKDLQNKQTLYKHREEEVEELNKQIEIKNQTEQRLQEDVKQAMTILELQEKSAIEKARQLEVDYQRVNKEKNDIQQRYDELQKEEKKKAIQLEEFRKQHEETVAQVRKLTIEAHQGETIRKELEILKKKYEKVNEEKIDLLVDYDSLAKHPDQVKSNLTEIQKLKQELALAKNQVRVREEELQVIYAEKNNIEQNVSKQKDAKIKEVEALLIQAETENGKLKKELAAFRSLNGGPVEERHAWKGYVVPTAVVLGAGVVAKLFFARK